MSKHATKPITAGEDELTSEASHGSLATYATGFVLSLALTLLAYMAVRHGSLSKYSLLVLILTLAVTQFAVQMVFFLHLGKKSRPRWNLTVFSFMMIVLGILVFGSLWIMHNLNYHMHDPASHMTDQEIIEDEGIYQ